MNSENNEELSDENKEELSDENKERFRKDNKNSKKRENSLHPPYNFFQLMLYLIIIWNCLMFYLNFDIYNIDTLSKVKLNINKIFAGMLLIFGITYIFLFFVLSCKESSGINYNELSKKRRWNDNLESQENESNLDFYCKICKINVEESTKHCFKCNKCIRKYDCHNKCYNTCIGYANANIFLCITIIKFIFFGLKIIFIITFLLKHDLHKFALLDIIFILMDFICSVIISIIVLDTLIFQMYIRLKGIKTFQHNEKKTKQKKLTKKKFEKAKVKEKFKEDNNDNNNNIEKDEEIHFRKKSMENLIPDFNSPEFFTKKINQKQQFNFNNNNEFEIKINPIPNNLSSFSSSRTNKDKIFDEKRSSIKLILHNRFI